MTITSPVESVAIFFAALFVSVPYASLFEWLLHKYFMHRKPGIGRLRFEYAFKAHAGVHHGTFKADNTYHLQHEEDKHLIPMAWWNGVVLIAVGLIPFIILGYWTIHSVNHWIAILGGIALGCSLYYAVYEFMHWCMHNPLVKQRLIERFVFFKKLNGHHVLHHRYMNKNYNVVLPLWDLLLGTLLKRSPFSFPQVRGRSVPDVQPLDAQKTEWARPK